jgi:hypothetical protein
MFFAPQQGLNPFVFVSFAPRFATQGTGLRLVDFFWEHGRPSRLALANLAEGNTKPAQSHIGCSVFSETRPPEFVCTA